MEKNLKENKDILYFKKVVKASAQEIEKHSNFLKMNLKKNFLIKFSFIKFFKINFFFKFYSWITRIV